jgi:DHA2 family multidrug resistance protein
MPGRSKSQTNPWLIAVVVSLATFMEVMDTSIANVALRHIAGSVAASQSESTWVLTSYLVSNAIILPISGWLASAMGRKRFYMTCVALFTVSSFLCGIAPTLGLLLFFRVLQGAGGAGLAPSEQAILADTFSDEQRGMAFAVYGIAVVVAPAVGPALGGWITDAYSWRWIFFINIPVGVLSLCLTWFLVQDSKNAQLEHRRATKGGLKVDYIGFALIGLGLGCLQIVLDKGQEDDWFGSTFITCFVIIAAIGILGGILWELFVAKDPMVDLPLFKDKRFLTINLMMFALFFVLLSSTQLLPQLVQELLAYNATKSGLVLMPGGFVLMLLMPVAGYLVRKVQPKYLMTFGFITVGFALHYLATLNADASFSAIAWGRIYQIAGTAFIFVPINTLAYAKLPPGKSNNASALINLMRNLGGSVGISMAATLLVRREQEHQTYLVAHLTPTSPLFRQWLAHITQRFISHGSSAATAHHQAIAAVTHQLQTQTSMLSYIDVFQILMFGCGVAAVLTLFVKKIKPGEAQPAA